MAEVQEVGVKKIAMLVMVLMLGVQLFAAESRDVVRVTSNKHRIDISYRGKLVELIDTDGYAFLSQIAPGPDENGVPWEVEIKNLGPLPVDVTDAVTFHLTIAVGESRVIYSNGVTYLVKR
jgi:hypothetical protein